MKHIGSIAGSMAYGKSIIVDVMHNFFFSRKRSSERVAKDYDRGEWLRNLDQMKFKQFRDLASWNSGWNEGGTITATIEGKLVKIDASEYYEFRTKKLVSLLDEFFGGSSELCELGCGSGRNLFAIKQLKPDMKIFGYDISDVGIETVKRISEHFNVEGINVGTGDLLSADGLSFNIENKNVFTYFVLEQLPDALDIFFENVIKGKPKKVLHLEPTYELLNNSSLRDLASKAYVERQDYVRTLLEKLRALEDDGRIEILSIRRELYSSSVKQMPTLACWRPL